ncbi:TRAP transporter small permease [Rubrimonas cliftonensis]|uniref:TRAP transporter small permease protein n=1 Tax=Rubrimonas cliftonensis TaxID=89524 RepID=A0A1H4DHE9_9RHOB|nr:TRAP transporter small permease [Rubrimonas cliftonensis]SEA72191.1 TRAP-type C4-dicarboxylate transport system, small permease component [Rubrimonas cliftonensis]
MYARLERAADLLARAMAYLGGAALLALTLATTVSILGRALAPLGLGVGPIAGIYDLTEIGVAVAVFAFLPWRQLNGGHARVELLTPVLPGPANRAIDLIADLAMTVVAVAGAWRLWLGLLDKARYGETTLILQVPVWTAYAGCLVGAVGFALVAAFCALRSARALWGGDGADREAADD